MLVEIFEKNLFAIEFLGGGNRSQNQGKYNQVPRKDANHPPSLCYNYNDLGQITCNYHRCNVVTK